MNNRSNLHELFNALNSTNTGEARILSAMYDFGTPIVSDVMENIGNRAMPQRHRPPSRRTTNSSSNSDDMNSNRSDSNSDSNGVSRHSDSNSAQYNVFTSEQEIKIIVFLPGVKKENVKVNINKAKLIVNAKTNVKEEGWEHLKETAYECNIKLEEHLKKDNLIVKFSDGILKIIIKKDVDDESIEIEID